MRDILEEEERRKKAAVKETTATAGSRRAYAETTNKVMECMFDSYVL
jgi:PERQ amino acid-rich with GYF domain-containing protein